MALRLCCFYGDLVRSFVSREQFSGRDRRKSLALLSTEKDQSANRSIHDPEIVKEHLERKDFQITSIALIKSLTEPSLI